MPLPVEPGQPDDANVRHFQKLLEEVLCRLGSVRGKDLIDILVHVVGLEDRQGVHPGCEDRRRNHAQLQLAGEHLLGKLVFRSKLRGVYDAYVEAGFTQPLILAQRYGAALDDRNRSGEDRPHSYVELLRMRRIQ